MANSTDNFERRANHLLCSLQLCGGCVPLHRLQFQFSDSLDSSANHESLPGESYKDLHGRSDRLRAVRGNEGLKALREKKKELEQKRRIRINEFINSKLSIKGNRK